MIGRWLTLLTGMLVLSVGILIAADPAAPDDDTTPIRLKKKKKVDPDKPPVENDNKPDDKKPGDKKPDDKKPDDKKPDEPGEVTKDGEPVTPDEEDKEVFERIAKNMKASEDRLANKEVNDGTRQIQEDIIKDLDALIKSSEGGGGGGGGQDQDQMQNDGGQENQKQQGKSGQGGQSMKKQGGRKMAGQKRGGQQQAKRQGGKQGGDKNQGGQDQGNQQANKGDNGEKNQGGQNTGKNPGGGGNTDLRGDPNRDADLYKDVWGHLPEVLRAQMDAYSSREKYMDKHHDLIKQYYKSIAAQGRKKGE